MWPVATLASFQLPAWSHGYAFFAGLAFVVAWWIRSRERARLEWARDPRLRIVGAWALVGAVIGAKLGMVLFVPWSNFTDLVGALLVVDFSGKTVVGALVGGFIAVEWIKRRVGIHESTGDIYALALPVGQALGRVGCSFHGCCFGTPTGLAWAQQLGGVDRHPVALYEALACLVLAGILWRSRQRVLARGVLFRRYLVGYATIRFSVEFLRGDEHVSLGALTLVQWACLAAILGFWRSARLPPERVQWQ